MEEQNLDPLFPEKYAYSSQINCIARIKMVFFTTQLFWQKLSGIPLFSALVALRVGNLFLSRLLFCQVTTTIILVNQFN